MTINNNEILSEIRDTPDSTQPDYSGTGTIKIINSSDGSTIVSAAGTVNYGTGIVTLNNFTPSGLPNTVSDFRVTAGIQESSQNIQANKQQVLVLDDSTLNAFAGTAAGINISVIAQ